MSSVVQGDEMGKRKQMKRNKLSRPKREDVNRAARIVSDAKHPFHSSVMAFVAGLEIVNKEELDKYEAQKARQKRRRTRGK